MVRALVEAGVSPRVIVRDPTRIADASLEVAVATYGDRVALAEALEGVARLFFVSAGEAADRVDLHRSVVDEAAKAGVAHIVYTSFLGAAPDATFTFARDHFHTEEHIKQSGLGHTFLRDSLYLDVLPFMVGEGDAIRGPAGTGRFAPVARDDVAAAASEALLNPGAHAGRTYDLTGPDLVDMDGVALELSRVTGQRISYVPETMEEAYASRAHYEAEPWEVAGWVTSYAAIAAGELAARTDDVERITGRPPQGVRDWLEAHPDAYAHLVA